MAAAITNSFKAADGAGAPQAGEITGAWMAAVSEELRPRGLVVQAISENKSGLNMEISFGKRV